MRFVFTFLSGFVFGAITILAWVHETKAEGVAATTVGARNTVRASIAQPASLDLRKHGLLIPVAGVKFEQLKSDFHDARGGGRTHGAIDILAPRGTPVFAVADGHVRKLFTSKAGGLTIYQYDVAEERCYYYAHLDRYAAGVREGLKVSRGDVIGYVGTTGNSAPDAPHLHFGVTILPPTKEWWKGESIDPFPLFSNAAALSR